MTRRALFIDRDGVLLDSPVEAGVPRPPRSMAEFAYLPDVTEALSLLRSTAFVPVVVTNQPDVPRGLISRSLVDQFHDRLRRDHGLAHIYTCFHDDADYCACRKPAPGLLEEAARDLDLSLPDSFLVGDRWRDIDAGRRAGCVTFLVRRPYSGESRPDVSVSNLLEAVRHITRSLDRGKFPWTSRPATSTT
jgi:D-glycero-D-manno-heptose 1,7-bisphosphate phosphatase